MSLRGFLPSRQRSCEVTRSISERSTGFAMMIVRSRSRRRSAGGWGIDFFFSPSGIVLVLLGAPRKRRRIPGKALRTALPRGSSPIREDEVVVGRPRDRAVGGEEPHQ